MVVCVGFTPAEGLILLEMLPREPPMGASSSLMGPASRRRSSWVTRIVRIEGFEVIENFPVKLCFLLGQRVCS